ncbi:MAG: response regulator, partial [Anaerolineales bacterium]|nr:response regulator [Anaerolineales bacterium]
MTTHLHPTYHVLVVDDEFLEGELITVFLDRIGHFQTTLASTLQELWKCLAEAHYDILLMDYRLPDGTGLDALGELPLRGYSIPVIMLTGQGDERIAAMSIQKGARDYLVKGNDILTSLPARIQKAIQDHTVQVTAAKSLEQIRYQALLLNNVRDAVVVWDMADRITFWNPAAERLFGLPADKMLNTCVQEHYFNLFTPTIRIPEPEQTSGQQIERDFQNPHGEMVWVSSQVSTLRDFTKNGQIIGFMDVCRDITKSKHLEAKLVQSAWMASFGELASGVAHQINNPLTTVIAEAQMLLRDLPTGHPSRDFAEAIEEAGWRTQKIVEKLLEFSHPSSESFQVLNINQTIENSLHLVGESIRSTGISLETELHPGLPPIYGNVRRLEVLWVNLLRHVRRANQTDRDDLIRIRSFPGPQASIVIEVQDLHQTITLQQLQAFFEPHLSNPTSGWETGIELSICREIVH